MSSVRVVDKVTIYRDADYYCGPGPSVVCDSTTGRLTVAFRRVPSWLDEGLAGHWHPSTESCLTHSDDGGGTWTQPQVFLAGAQCPNLCRLRDGTLLQHTHRFELVNEAIYESKSPAHRTLAGWWRATGQDCSAVPASGVPWMVASPGTTRSGWTGRRM